MKQLTIDTNYSASHPVKQEEILLFEKKYNVKLPNYFIDFLIQYKGGRTKEHIFFLNSNEYGISSFLPFSYNRNDCIEKIYDVTISKEVDGGLERADLIPFATDGGGNLYYLSIGKEDNDTVYYERLWTGKLRKLSNSFEEFIDGLYPENVS